MFNPTLGKFSLQQMIKNWTKSKPSSHTARSADHQCRDLRCVRLFSSNQFGGSFLKKNSWASCFPSLHLHLFLSYEREHFGIFLYWKWAIPGLFLFFSFFSKAHFTETNCRLRQDSNSDRWDWRQTLWPFDHHHGPLHFGIVSLSQYTAYHLGRSCSSFFYQIKASIPASA